MNSLSSYNTEINEEVVKTISQRWELTQEDLKRQFTEAELKMLCLKHKTRVDMWKCNPVNDMKEKLKRDGRFKRRSVKYRLHLIAKGVNKYKHKIMYDPNILQNMRNEFWRDRLKNSILSLEMWVAEEKQTQQNKEPEYTVEEYLELLHREESEVVSLSQHLGVEVELGGFEHFANELSGSSNRKAQQKHQINIQNTSELNSEHVRREIADALDVNTDSLSLNTQEALDSELFSAPTNYADFNDRVPLTSTQSMELAHNPIIF
uniref:Uncharacterized protein n=1 Tax=Glossina brevipalpis TaxID=37001 RepID=A0A1A9X142_9MUSC